MSTRLSKGGRLIDRSKALEFAFNGKRLRGHEGDTLASVSYTHLTLPTICSV